MAKVLDVSLDGAIKATYRKTGNDTLAAATVTINNKDFNEVLINGTGDAEDVVNLLYSKKHSISSGAGVTVDLTSVTDDFGDSISISNKKLILIKNLADAGSGMELICATLFAAGVVLQPQEWRMFGCAQVNGLADVPSSFAFTTASGTAFDFELVVIGIND